MTITYKKITITEPKWEYIEMLDSDNPESVTVIPIDPANSDYQRYLEHLTENPTEDVE